MKTINLAKFLKGTTNPKDGIIDRDEIYEQRRRWRLNIPDLFKGAYRRTWDKAIAKKSMRAAVDAKCQDCTNWQQAEVRDCPVTTCPLFEYRPYQVKQASHVDSGAVAMP